MTEPKIKFPHLDELSLVELIEEVGRLGGGDDWDGAFTKEGEQEFKYAQNLAIQKITQLEAQLRQVEKQERQWRKVLQEGATPLAELEAQLQWAQTAKANIRELRTQMLACKVELLGGESKVGKIFAGRITEWCEIMRNILGQESE